MNNKKGYLLYELLISFSLTFIIILNMFITITNLSNKLAILYEKNLIISNQMSLYNMIGPDFMQMGIEKIDEYKPQDVLITYNEGTKKELAISSNSISYGGKTIKFKKGTIGEMRIKVISTTFNNANYPLYNKMVYLNIPIEYNDEHFDIELFCTNEIAEDYNSY